MVTCEQTFNAMGNVLDPICSQLKPQNLKLLMCVANWSTTQSRQQHAEIGSPEASDLFYTDNMRAATAPKPASDPKPHPDLEE